MKRFVAVATETNVLNLVAVLALADANDEVVVLQDHRAREARQGERLKSVLADRGHTTLIVDVDGASPEALQAALAAGGRLAQHDTGTDDLLAIGGRKRDTLMLAELLRRQARQSGRTWQVISIGEKPACVEWLKLDDPAGVLAGSVALHELPGEKCVRLDDVLRLHDYVRSPVKPGTRLVFAAPFSLRPPSQSGQTQHGDALEHLVAHLVHAHLATELRQQVAEIWFGVEMRHGGATLAASEFDVLLLLRDGRGIHFECKSGGTGGAKALQAKMFQLRRALTPHSGFVLCRQAPSKNGNRAQLHDIQSTRAALARTYQHLGNFGVWLIDATASQNQHMRGLAESVRGLQF